MFQYFQKTFQIPAGFQQILVSGEACQSGTSSSCRYWRPGSRSCCTRPVLSASRWSRAGTPTGSVWICTRHIYLSDTEGKAHRAAKAHTPHTSLIFVTKIKTRTRIIGLRFKEMRTRLWWSRKQKRNKNKNFPMVTTMSHMQDEGSRWHVGDVLGPKDQKI